jgi:hypothetical protein
MDGNVKFPHPPVKIADLRAALEDFDTARATLFDGGKQVFALRDKCRDIVVKLLIQLGHYVEAVAEDDMVVFVSSGFFSRRMGGNPPLATRQTACRRRESDSGHDLLLPGRNVYRMERHRHADVYLAEAAMLMKVTRALGALAGVFS